MNEAANRNGSKAARKNNKTESNGGSARTNGHRRPVLITGGAGFIGSNLAHRLLASGERVIIFDNLSRPGVELNLRWLRSLYPNTLEVQIGDVRDFRTLLTAVSRASHVFHLAAQVAVTTSLKDPIFDFEVNTRGTLNLLEALRTQKNPPPLLFTSTNKVYGDLAHLELTPDSTRYCPTDTGILSRGVSEETQLDFHSPYGCSKGIADQYVLDYARTFDLPTTVFRMSCIYGPHQFGNEDQGWVAHFLIRAVNEEPITIYGDGRQVRDVLFVEDLVSAFLLARENLPAVVGNAFNIGGGPANTTSLLELVGRLERMLNRPCKLDFDTIRRGDQPYYVSDTTKFREATGWSPEVGIREGLDRLHGWILESSGRLLLAVTAHQASQPLLNVPALSGGSSDGRAAISGVRK